MLSEEHRKILKQGTEAWNQWRDENPDVKPDFRGVYLSWVSLNGAHLNGADFSGASLIGARLNEANLSGANLSRANLGGARLSNANLSGTVLSQANLSMADLTGADLSSADLYRADLSKGSRSLILARFGENLSGANLSQADLSKANLNEVDLSDADLSGANLSNANLERAQLINTNLQDANMTGCHVYGISAWNVQLEGTIQTNLVITPRNDPVVTVDNLEVAQFIYLILNREKIRNVLNTITSKSVLILGRFTPERKAVLDAMSDELRTHDFLPIIFDFERATSRDFTETVKTLAGLSLFVIVDITSPKSSPLELQATVPDYQMPFVPIIQQGEKPFSMFSDLQKYDWVLQPVLEYASKEKLLQGFRQAIIERAWKKHQELQAKKVAKVEVQSVEEFLRGTETT